MESQDISASSETLLAADAKDSHPKLVKIDINGRTYDVSQGNHTVAALKKIAQVPLPDELERVVNQRLVPLPDDAVVAVQECEWFVSHPRDCQSS